MCWPGSRCRSVRPAGTSISAERLSPASAVKPAASMPAMAAVSSLSDVSPEMPTAPMTAPALSRISTPPTTGSTRPPDTSEMPATRCGRSLAMASTRREPMPDRQRAIGLAGRHLGRRNEAPSCRWKATRWPPASSTETPSGLSLRSAPLAKAASMICLAFSSVSVVMNNLLLMWQTAVWRLPRKKGTRPCMKRFAGRGEDIRLQGAGIGDAKRAACQCVRACQACVEQDLKRLRLRPFGAGRA